MIDLSFCSLGDQQKVFAVVKKACLASMTIQELHDQLKVNIDPSAIKVLKSNRRLAGQTGKSVPLMCPDCLAKGQSVPLKQKIRDGVEFYGCDECYWSRLVEAFE